MPGRSVRVLYHHCICYLTEPPDGAGTFPCLDIRRGLQSCVEGALENYSKARICAGRTQAERDQATSRRLYSLVAAEPELEASFTRGKGRLSRAGGLMNRGRWELDPEPGRRARLGRGQLTSGADPGRKTGPAHIIFHALQGAACLGVSDMVLGEG